MIAAIAPAPERPIALRPDFSGMPAELKPLRIWVVWRYEWDGKKKWKKVPYIPISYNARQLRKAKTNTPSTWKSYDDAKKVYLASPDLFDGVGVVLDGDLIGGDFDHCYDPATDQRSDFAHEHLPPTYTEYSPSGTGYRFLAHGAITRPHKTMRAELYDRTSPRFLTLTGRRLAGQPTTIEHCQTAIDAIEVALAHEPTNPRTTRTGTPRKSGRDRSRLQVLADIPESDWKEANHLYRTQADSLERRFRAAAWKEETQWWFAARRDYAGFHAKYPFVGLYDAAGELDPSQARMATARATRGLGFSFAEHAALMNIYFADDRAQILARWGTKELWRAEIADIWQKAAPAKRGLWQPRAKPDVAKKPVGRSSNHAEQIERVYQLLVEYKVGDKAIIKTADLAAAADMHRVTLSGILAELRDAKRIATQRLGRYGGLVVSFPDVAILSKLPIAAPAEPPPIEETHTHNCVSSPTREAGYSSELPDLALFAAQYLDARPVDVGKRIVSAEGIVTYRRTAQHFADLVTAEYSQVAYADALAAYRAEQERRRQAEREAWKQFFAELKAMTDDELIAYIGGRCRAQVLELAREKHIEAAFDIGLYKARLKCAKQHLAWRGLVMPEKATNLKAVTPMKPKRVRPVACQQIHYEQPKVEPKIGTLGSLLQGIKQYHERHGAAQRSLE